MGSPPKARRAAVVSWHRCPDRLSHWNAGRLEVVKAMNVDSQIVRSHALAMERVDAADLAEEVNRGFRMEPVLGKRLRSRQQFELALVHFDHERILPLADRAVAYGELR